MKSVKVNEILQKLWEIKERPIRDDKILTTEDQAAIEKATNSIQYNNGRYQIGIPWKKIHPAYQIIIAKSLNDMMFPGPKLQRELNNVLLRF